MRQPYQRFAKESPDSAHCFFVARRRPQVSRKHGRQTEKMFSARHAAACHAGSCRLLFFSGFFACFAGCRPTALPIRSRYAADYRTPSNRMRPYQMFMAPPPCFATAPPFHAACFATSNRRHAHSQRPEEHGFRDSYAAHMAEERHQFMTRPSAFFRFAARQFHHRGSFTLSSVTFTI